MSDRSATATPLEQNQALRDYLDALLSEVPAGEGEEADADLRPRPTRAVPDGAGVAPAAWEAMPADPTPVSEAPVVTRPAPAEPVTPSTPREGSPGGASAALAPEVRAGSGDGDAHPGSGVPAWATPDFQALLFYVGRLNLAVPLVELHSVVPWDDSITAMPNQPEWCHGVFRYRERNVTVIDTATLVLPDHSREDNAAAKDVENAHILVVGDGRWGLVCHTIGEVTRLTPDEVKWRRAGGQRPWLAGTVLGRLCALMDTRAFADMLARGWSTRGKGG